MSAANTHEVSGTELAVVLDIIARQQMGMAKYGVSVADNPLALRAWLTHQYEELLDAAIYCKRAIQEIDKGNGNGTDRHQDNCQHVGSAAACSQREGASFTWFPESGNRTESQDPALVERARRMLDKVSAEIAGAMMSREDSIKGINKLFPTQNLPR